MLHNFSILFHSVLGVAPQWFEIQAKNLDDALIALYEAYPNAEYLEHNIDINPSSYESENDTIKAALLDRSKK
jgi:hypothetical protein